MLRRISGEWKLYPHKVKYKQNGEEKEQYALPSREWWEETCSKHDNLGLIGFEEIELTQEQQNRLEDIKDLRIGEGHMQTLIDYVLEGVFPEGNRIMRDFEQQKRIEALEKASGAGGQAGKRGIAQRIDKLEDDIAEIKEELNKD